MIEKSFQGVLVWLEWEGSQFHPVSFELLGAARRLAKVSGEPVYAVGIGRGIHKGAYLLSNCGAKQVILCETKKIYQSDVYASIFAHYIRQISPGTVLVGGTLEGRALAPRLAVCFQTGLTADCTQLEMEEDGGLIQIRPAFGGNLMAKIVTESARPQFATVRPGVMSPEEPSKELSSIQLDVDQSEDGSMEILTEEILNQEKRITEAKILVAAGRGVKKKEDLAILRNLADSLGGMLASSRALVEKGWMQPKDQIGLSGNTVAPDYLLTFGVSGTVQFMAGMKGSRHIIAVNTDPEARIFQIAHDPICADLYEVAPRLAKLTEEKIGENVCRN